MKLLNIRANGLAYLLTFLILSLLLKDFFKILTYFIPVNINYLFLPIYAVLLLFGLGQIYFRRRISLLQILLFTFILWTNFALLLYFLLSNAFNYTPFNLVVIIFFQGVIPLTLLLLAILHPNKMYDAIRNSNVILAIITITVTSALLVFFIINPKEVTDFFVTLMKKDLIVNPIQTHKGGTQLRFSSIFYSAFSLALYCNVMIAFALFFMKSPFKKALVVCIVLPLLIMTFNRNGMAVALFSITSYFCWKYFKSIFTYYMATILFLITLIVILLPLLLNLVEYNFEHSSKSGMFTKLSTLAVRFDAWASFLSPENYIDILIGKGFVQGVAETTFYLDNGFYYIVSQNGILALVLFFITVSITFIKLKRLYQTTPDNNAALCMTLLIGGLIAMFLNNSFYENIFLVFYWTFPLLFVFKSEYNNKISTAK